MPNFTVNLPKSNVRAPHGAQMRIQGGTQELNNDTEFNIVITPENEQYVPSTYVQKGLVPEPITIGYQGNNILQEYSVGAPVSGDITNPFYHYVPNQDDIWPEPRNLIDKTISFKLRSNAIVTDVVLEVNKKYFSIHTPEAAQGYGEELIYLYRDTPSASTLILDSQSEWYMALPLRGGLAADVVATFDYGDNILPQGWYYLVYPQSGANDSTISTLQVTNNHFNNYTKMKIDSEIIKLEGRTRDNKYWRWFLGAGGEFRQQDGSTPSSTWSHMPLLPKVYHNLQTEPEIEDLHLINFFNYFFVLYKSYTDYTDPDTLSGLVDLLRDPTNPSNFTNTFLITDRRFPYRNNEHCEFINWTGHSQGHQFFFDSIPETPGARINDRVLAFILAEGQ